MARIPVRFKRVVAAFDEVARLRPCESSGSDHSPENLMTDLSDLVNSFIERSGREEEDMEQEKESEVLESESLWSDSETKDLLQNLLGGCGDKDDDDDVKQKLIAETENACMVAGSSSSQGFKRRLMTCLRERGFDAGLCKSQWEKTGRLIPGEYEYIDVNMSGTRYVVEVLLAGEFEIARPTSRYTSLLDVFPPIFVGKLGDLKQLVRIMSAAMKESIKANDMHVPPWRRNGYMQAKWFGSYKRTINSGPATKMPETGEGLIRKQSIGFEASTRRSYYCRDDFASKVGLRVGHLTAAFNGNGMEI